MNVKDIVKMGKLVNFQYYRENTFFYKTECGLIFPVPLEDIGNATLLNADKAILFMRYIRKHLETLKNKE